MKIGDIVKLHNLVLAAGKKESTRITRIKSINDHGFETICKISWWFEKPVDKGPDYEILTFSDYLRLIKI